MECRAGCGACCIAPSISSPLPGMPDGKPAGVMCVNLDPASHRCRIWGQADYPEVCRRFQAEAESCGASRSEALELLAVLELITADEARDRK
jgi:Fe-S-cluster containining protein